MAENFHLHQRLSYATALCTVRYIGPVSNTTGDWLGVEWDDALRGRHSGVHQGTQYFTTRIPDAGSFIRPARAPDPTHTFLDALRRKYATSDAEAKPAISLSTNKVFQEVGFEKIAAKQSQLGKLKVVLLDAQDIDSADTAAEITETCPNIMELDLSRNRFEHLQTVADIVAALPNLHSLRINGNRFSSYTLTSPDVFHKITTLEISSLVPTTSELELLLSYFPHTHTIIAHHNSLTEIAPELPFPQPLTAIDLAHNRFPTLASLHPLAALPNLHTLLLSHNLISTLTSAPFPHITRLDLSFNTLRAFSTLDALPTAVPTLGNLRISHNPFVHKKLTLEEVNMICIARLADTVTVLNHSNITYKERENAELWYLGRVAAEMAGMDEDAQREVLKEHGRWGELCKLHGEPAIPKSVDDSDRSLKGSRVVSVTVREGEREWVKEVPRGVSVSAVRKVVAQLLGWRACEVAMSVHGTEGESPIPLWDAREFGDLGVAATAQLVVSRI